MLLNAFLIVASPALTPPVPVAAGVNTAGAADHLLVSHNGHTYTPGSDANLFADAGRVVPGDVTTERLWMRNAAPEPGTLRLYLVNVATDDLDLAQNTEITLTDGAGTELGKSTLGQALSAGGCTRLTDDVLVAPDETVPLDIALAQDPSLGSERGDDGREGTLGSVQFQVRATLSDAQAGSGEDDDCPRPLEPPTPDRPELGGGQPSEGDGRPSDGEDGTQGADPDLDHDGHGQQPSEGQSQRDDLSFTGSQFSAPALVLGAVLVGGGLAAFLLSRREQGQG